MAFVVDDIANLGTAALTAIQAGIKAAWPGPEASANAQATIIEKTAAAAISEMQQRMSIMLAEANSDDKWTSRARPSFLYVMYIMILTCIPFAVLWAVSPEIGDRVASGMQKWLAALPESLWSTMQLCFSVYAGGRSVEKVASILKK